MGLGGVPQINGALKRRRKAGVRWLRRYPPLVFVSHKRGVEPDGDEEFSRKLVQDLRVRLGSEQDVVWYDTLGGVTGGSPFERVIISEIERRPFFLVILSPNAMVSPWVKKEITTALKAKNERPKEPRVILPIEYLPTIIPADLNPIGHLSNVSFATPRPYEKALEELVTDINTNYVVWKRYTRKRQMVRVGIPLLLLCIALVTLFIRWYQPGPAPTICVPAGAVRAGAWGNAGNILVGRTGFGAVTLANGQALIAGGTIPVSSAAGYTTDSELYDPTTCAWHHTGPLLTGATVYGETTLNDGRIMIVGGFGPPLKTVQLYDPGAGAWSSMPGLANGRDLNTATRLVNGDILVTGGWDGFQMNSTEIEDPSTETWRQAASMLLARSSHQAILLPDGSVLVAGGTLQDNTTTAECEIYDPHTNRWRVTGSMHVPRSTFTSVLLPSGKVLVAGGDSLTGLTSSAELYDPSTEKWTMTGSMHSPRAFTAGQGGVVLRNDDVLVAGGDRQGTSEEYNPSTGAWSAPVKMLFPHCHAAVTLLNDGRVLIIGGDDCVNQQHQIVASEVYTPKS